MSTKLSDRNKKLTIIPDPQSPDSAGFMTTTADDVVPTGWLEANGQAVSRTTYSELFALIGTTYGAGDGSTTFNLPGGDLANHRITDKTTDGSVLILADTSMTSDNLTIDAGDTITVNSGANLNSLDKIIVDGTLVAGGTVKTGSLVNANNPTFDSVSTTSLSVDGKAISRQARSICHSYLSVATQNLTNNVLTKLALDATQFDTNGDWDTANDRFVVPRTGYYSVFGQAAFTGSGSYDEGETRSVNIFLNSTRVAVSSYVMPASPTTYIGNLYTPVSAIVYATAGDFITLEAIQDSGATLTVSGGTDVSKTFLMIKEEPVNILD